MHLPQLDLSVWSAILVGLAAQLACEAAAVLFVSSWAGRPWRERTLAIIPFAALIGLALAARDVQAQVDFWSHYFAFLQAHYPPSHYSELAQQTQQDYASAVEGVNRLGWIAVLITETLAALYGALLFHWFASPKQADKIVTPIQEDGDEVEFLIEPLDRPGRS
jgi:hypothetical protein